MTITQPVTDQLRFLSAKTGDQQLDAYLEACERNGAQGAKTLSDLLALIFDTDGAIAPPALQYRTNPATGELQFRSGVFSDPNASWNNTGTFIFKDRGAHANATAYNRLDLVTYNGQLYYCNTAHTSNTAAPSANFTLAVSQLAPTLTPVTDANKLIQVNAGGTAYTLISTLPIAQGGTGGATADAALNGLINGATADQSPAMSDKIPYNKAASTAGRTLTFQQHWNTLNGLTAYSALLINDEIAIRDGSGANGVRKMSIANFLAGFGYQGRNIAGRNGGLEVWQRGAGGGPASFAVPASTTRYTADGWAIKTNANQACTVTQTARLNAGARWCALIQRNNGQTGVGTIAFEFPLDSDEVAMIQSKNVAISLDLQAGANWSATSGNITVELRTGTGSPAKRSAGAYTGDAAPVAETIKLTPGGAIARFSPATNSGLAGAVAHSVTQASIYITWTPTGTAGDNDWVIIDDVQLETNTFATPFERRPFFLELLACQRHYEKTYNYGVAPATVTSVGCQSAVAFGAGVSEWVDCRFKVVKRATPTITIYSDTTGASGNIRTVGIGDLAGTPTAIGDHGFVISATAPSAALFHAHYVADAGI